MSKLSQQAALLRICSMSRYVIALLPLLALMTVLHTTVQLSAQLIINHSLIWSSIKDLMMFVVIFTPAAVWVHRPIRGAILSQNPQALEETMTHLPVRALRGFTIAGLVYIVYLFISVIIFSAFLDFTLTPKMTVAMGLNVTYNLGILIPFIATALSITWMVRVRKRLSVQQLFVGDLNTTQAHPWLLRSYNRPWLIFGATSLVPVATLAIFSALMFGDSNTEEQQFILMQAVILFVNLIIGGTSLIWITSNTVRRITQELASGLNFLRLGKFDGHVAVMIDDDMGELARGLNTALVGLKERDDLKDSIAIASEIQRGLMPKSEPMIQGYAVFGYQQSCYAVGGDYFDYIERSNGSLWLVIADVAGKGYPAALTVANLQAMLHVLANSESITLIDAVTYINQSLHMSMQGGRFVTLFIAELQPENNELHWINAGHTPPLLWHNNSIRSLEASSPPLGMLDNLAVHTESVSLAIGDALFACTDGITEARHASDGKMFGDKRVQSWFAKHKQLDPVVLPESLLTELDDTGFIAREDDITMLCLKRSYQHDKQR